MQYTRPTIGPQCTADERKAPINENPLLLLSPSLQSMLKRVTSRVSQWFSPTTNPSPNSSDQQQSQEPGIGEDATSRDYNSHHHRRRCSDIISPDVAVEEAKTQPPLKRSKTTMVEVTT